VQPWDDRIAGVTVGEEEHRVGGRRQLLRCGGAAFVERDDDFRRKWAQEPQYGPKRRRVATGHCADRKRNALRSQSGRMNRFDVDELVHRFRTVGSDDTDANGPAARLLGFSA
jgi:hypothetical protein